MRSKDKAKKIIKKKLVSLALIIIKPFIIPFLMITLLIWLCCYITDIFYIGTYEKYEKDFKSELKYYTANEYTEEEKNVENQNTKVHTMSITSNTAQIAVTKVSFFPLSQWVSFSNNG